MKPSLILMDEVLDYATKAASVRVGRNTFLVDQVQSFVKALTQAVDRHGTSMLVLTLTSSPQQIYGEEAINTLKLWKNFPRYDYLPILNDQTVLRDSISCGVSRGLFAYCTGTPENFDRIHIDKHLPSAHCVLSDHAWLLDASTARKLIAPPDGPDDGKDIGTESTGGEPPDDNGTETGGGGDETRQPKHYTELDVEIELESSDWRQFHSSVIKPLVDKGANTKISVSLSAAHAEGFDRDVIELSIREGAIQINPAAKVKTNPT